MLARMSSVRTVSVMPGLSQPRGATPAARVMVDTYDGALAEAGDILIPLKKRLITRGHILADLHELVSGKKKVRTKGDEITLFKSVGCALEDLVTAELIAQA